MSWRRRADKADKNVQLTFWKIWSNFVTQAVDSRNVSQHYRKEMRKSDMTTEHEFHIPRQGEEISVVFNESKGARRTSVIIEKVYTEPPLTGIMLVRIATNPCVLSYVSHYGREQPVARNTPTRRPTNL